MIARDINYYKAAFSDLNPNKIGGLPAPHKPLLLLSVIDLIESGAIDTPRIYLTDGLVRKFDENARLYFGRSPRFKPDPFKPYHHLGHEPFWQLVPRNASQTATPVQQPMAAEPAPTTTVGSSHPSYTLKGMRAAYAYAQIDEELFDLLHDETVRAHLRTILISTYLAPHARQLPILEAIALLGSLASVIA